MATRSENFDVWFLAADTVYRGVPYDVLTGWADQGRVASDDKIRPAGTEKPWVRVADHPLISDFLFRRGQLPAATDAAEQLQPVELDVEFRKRGEDDDDDVDMIPLIDISLVLLIFFMMTTAVAALSPVDVPDMKHASELSKDVDAFTIQIDKRSSGETYYALRLGKDGPKPEDNNLMTLPELLARLDARLSEVQRPPEVRIACNKELPSQRVREVTRELEKRKAKGQIAYYSAEVNESK
jgi:biopolymer transport protein ExbD